MKKTAFVLAVWFYLAQAGDARATLMVRLDPQQLIERAERIVAAKCTGVLRVFLGPDGMRIYTEYGFEVEEELAGSGPARFSLVQPGGSFGRVVQKAWGYPSFAASERVVLFLEGGRDGLRLVGLGQGAFLRKGEEGLHQRLEGVRFLEEEPRPVSLTLPQLRRMIEAGRKAREGGQ